MKFDLTKYRIVQDSLGREYIKRRIGLGNFNPAVLDLEVDEYEVVEKIRRCGRIETSAIDGWQPEPLSWAELDNPQLYNMDRVKSINYRAYLELERRKERAANRLEADALRAKREKQEEKRRRDKLSLEELKKEMEAEHAAKLDQVRREIREFNKSEEAKAKARKNRWIREEEEWKRPPPVPQQPLSPVWKAVSELEDWEEACAKAYTSFLQRAKNRGIVEGPFGIMVEVHNGMPYIGYGFHSCAKVGRTPPMYGVSAKGAVFLHAPRYIRCIYCGYERPLTVKEIIERRKHG